jgi:hypothetical protein
LQRKSCAALIPLFRLVFEQKETTTVKLIRCCLFTLVFMLVVLPLVHAQTAAFYMGFGTNYDKANGSGISLTTWEDCTPAQGNTTCKANPNMSNLFLGFGGEAMVDKRFGINAEVSFQPTKGDYGPMQFRQTFYDFNGIFAPYNEKKVALKLLGGIGGARTGFSLKQSSCIGSVYCSSSTSTLGSANHFQVHAGAGVDVMLTNSLMIRPQFDFRYVPNLTDQFGRNTVIGGMVWIGFRVNNR